MAQAFDKRNPIPKPGKLLDQELDYGKIAKIIISRWYWIAATLIVALSLASTYLWYTPSTYATSTNIKFDERKSDFSDLVTIVSVEDRLSSKIQTENYVLKSREIILNAIKKLDYQVSYYIKGKARNSETYPIKPFIVNVIKQDTANVFKGTFDFQLVDKNEFEISYEFNGKQHTQTASYGDKIVIDKNLIFSILPSSTPAISESKYLFKFNTPIDFYYRIRNNINMVEAIKLGNIATITMTDQNAIFAADALNATINEYLNNDIRRKKQSSDQIIDFINSQLVYFEEEVGKSGAVIEDYKKNNQFLDITRASQSTQLKITAIEEDVLKRQIELVNLQQIIDVLNDKNTYNELNLSLFGSIDPSVLTLLAQYNALIIKKIDASAIYKADSQPIIELDNQIQLIRKTILTNTSNNKKLLLDQINEYKKELDKYYKTISSYPTAEKELLTLTRDFSLNEKIYSFLSEKKLEAQITRSSILGSASLVELAEPNLHPVSPNKDNIYRSAWILGILSGIGLIFLIRSMNPYIYDKETVESITNVPIIGVIRKYSAKVEEHDTQILSLKKPKSVFAESVRSVRTNLSFLASEKGSKVVCITSEISGEGKSFVTLNLASTLAMIDKKVILLAGDLRRSKMYKNFKANNDRGLSTYLSKQDTDLKSLIHHSDQKNLDYIVSGPVPPNPAELLYSERFIELIEDLKGIYDYILIDTAPVGLVSDAIPIIRQSDINLFIIRSGVSKYNAATIPQRIEQEYGLNNTIIVLNAFIDDPLHSRYYSTKYTGNYNGYYYSDYSGYSSYGYYAEDKNASWWKFWKKLSRKKAA